ncbi:MAG: hypothetical protein RL701_5315 [Pseudomonadota bacterium]|jgi:hypothetical protein
MKDPQQLGMEHAVGLGRRGPRLLGLVQIAFGVAAILINVLLLALLERYYAVFFVMGGLALAIGSWTLITGRTNSALPDKPPQWWTVGFYAAMVVGVLGGLYVSIALGK